MGDVPLKSRLFTKVDLFLLPLLILRPTILRYRVVICTSKCRSLSYRCRCSKRGKNFSQRRKNATASYNVILRIIFEDLQSFVYLDRRTAHLSEIIKMRFNLIFLILKLSLSLSLSLSIPFWSVLLKSRLALISVGLDPRDAGNASEDFQLRSFNDQLSMTMLTSVRTDFVF